MNHPTYSTNRIVSCLMLTVFAFLASTNAAFAQGLGFDLCNQLITPIFYGDLAPGIATLAVIALGVSAAFGRVTWGAAVLAAVGIAVIFGAGRLAQTVGGGC